jgi:hypothetical protein
MPGFNIPSIIAGCHDEFAVEATEGTVGIRRQPSSSIETFRSHRFRFEILGREVGFGLAQGIWQAYPLRCSRPSVEIDEITIHNGPDQIYRPGKVKWSPIQLTFYEIAELGEDLTPSAIFTMWAENTIDLKNSTIGKPSPTLGQRRRRGRRFHFDASLDMLDGRGDVLWSYRLYNCWPTKISPANVSYDESNILTTEITLRFDKANELST